MTGVLAALVGVSSGGFAVTANDVTRVQEGFTGIGLVTTTQIPNTTIEGGVPPYTYLWEYVSGSAVPAVNDASVANPQWSGNVADGDEEVAVWQVTVTDGAATEVVVEIFVTLIWLNLS